MNAQMNPARTPTEARASGSRRGRPGPSRAASVPSAPGSLGSRPAEAVAGGTIVGGPCCWEPRCWGNRVAEGPGPPRRWCCGPSAAGPSRGGSSLRPRTEPERRPREPGRCGHRAAVREGSGETAGRNCRTRGSGPALIPGSPRGALSLPVRRRRRARLR